MDSLVRRHIIQNKLNEDFSLIERIREITEADRVLDEPPEELRLKNVLIEYQGGVRHIFRTLYAAVFQEIDQSRKCKFDILGAEMVAEIPVICTLKALLLIGVTKNPVLSSACYTMFVNITTAEHGTTKAMMSRLPKDSYYTKELAKAIEESVKCN
jgi:hypothetical protein